MEEADAELDAAAGEGVDASAHHPLRSEWDGSGKGTASNDDLATKEFALLLSVVAPCAPCRLLVLGLSSRRTPLRTGTPRATCSPAAATTFLTDRTGRASRARGPPLHRRLDNRHPRSHVPRRLPSRQWLDVRRRRVSGSITAIH
jgi:hypothetical protein